MSDKQASLTKTYAQAWREYLDALEACRATVEANSVSADPKVRAAALFLPTQMQAGAFYMQLAPHMGYPLLNRTHVGEPIGMSWGLPNPDFDYRWTYLDGKRRYRIYGPRKSEAAFFDLIAFNGYFIDNVKTYFQGSLNGFDGPDGGIELFLGPPSKGPNHIDLDPTEPHNVLTLREALEDWNEQQPTPLRIECVDPPETLGPFVYPEADLVARLERATTLLRNTPQRTMLFHQSVLEGTQGKENTFLLRVTGEDRRKNNAHPGHIGCNAIYNIRRGQSLIIESGMPKTAVYWGIQLGDMWWRTTDFIWHQSSLNRRNAHFGPDGVFRAVLSFEDPGIQNWLDPVDLERGVLSIRYYMASDTPLPKTRLVPSAQLRQHLPSDIPIFTPDQRRAQIARRADGALRRFGY
jgi:hypothetical protein